MNRLRDRLTVVGLTGSQGKTGTKDLLAAVLSSVAPTIATIGSHNNELGVPLTMLHADAATRFLVLEMGARHVGDIVELTDLVAPDVAAVLNVGQAHLGEFGSREAIARTKGELVQGLASGGTAVLNADDPRVVAMRIDHPRPGADLRPGASTPTCGWSTSCWTGSAGRPSRCAPPTPQFPSRSRSLAPTRRSTRRLLWRRSGGRRTPRRRRGVAGHRLAVEVAHGAA